MRARYKGLLFGLAYGLVTASYHLSSYMDWSGDLFAYNFSRLLTTFLLPALIGMAIGYYIEWRRRGRP